MNPFSHIIGGFRAPDFFRNKVVNQLTNCIMKNDIDSKGVPDLNFLPQGASGDCIRRIFALESALQASLSSRLAPSHLSPAQMKLLARVARFGSKGCRVSDISKMQFFGSKQNVSSMLKKLSRSEYLAICEDDNDKRSHRYFMTERGMSKIAEFLPLHRQFMQDVFTALKHEDIITLSNLLKTLEMAVSDLRGK